MQRTPYSLASPTNRHWKQGYMLSKISRVVTLLEEPTTLIGTIKLHAKVEQ
jgi:hypothetical protein